MYEQLDLFSLMEQEKPQRPSYPRLSIGDYVGRVILGEVEKGRITKIEGNAEYFFYRTDAGIFYPAKSRTDFEQMEKEAAENRKKYRTIEIDKFDTFFAVEYPPGRWNVETLYAMIGIFDGMLFWKEDFTYQFLEPVKNIKKAYEKKVLEIKSECWKGKKRDYIILDKPIPTKRLYWSKRGFYSESGYVQFNG